MTTEAETPAPWPFKDEAEEARCLIEMLDEIVSRDEIRRLREIVTRARFEIPRRMPDVRELAEVVTAMEALRERIWVYRIAQEDRTAASGE